MNFFQLPCIFSARLLTRCFFREGWNYGNDLEVIRRTSIYCTVIVCGRTYSLKNKCTVESLQSHFILTMSHWSSGLPVCFPSQGTQVQIPRGVLMWNRDSPVSDVSLHWWPRRDWSSLWPRLRRPSSRTPITRPSCRQCDNPTWSHTAFLSRFHARCRSPFRLHNRRSRLLGGALWRACNPTSFSPCLTGPVDYLFASRHKEQRFKSPGGYLCETGILLLAMSRYSTFIAPSCMFLTCRGEKYTGLCTSTTTNCVWFYHSFSINPELSPCALQSLALMLSNSPDKSTTTYKQKTTKVPWDFLGLIQLFIFPLRPIYISLIATIWADCAAEITPLRWLPFMSQSFLLPHKLQPLHFVASYNNKKLRVHPLRSN